MKTFKNMKKTSFLFKIFGGGQSFFGGPLILLFWTSGDIYPGLQTHGGSPCLCALSPTHNGIPRFTSGVTPAHLLAASIATKPFSSTYWRTSIGGARDQDLKKGLTCTATDDVSYQKGTEKSTAVSLCEVIVKPANAMSFSWNKKVQKREKWVVFEIYSGKHSCYFFYPLSHKLETNCWLSVSSVPGKNTTPDLFN